MSAEEERGFRSGAAGIAARIEYAGARHDPVAATLFCAPTRARTTVVHGRVVVEDGRLVSLDLPPVVERHNRLSAALARG